jgi:DNA polymerase V
MDNLYLENDIMRADVTQSLPKYPLLGVNVPAGFPSPARDYVEDVLNLHELMVLHPAATYFIRAEGHSMCNANIRHGDILVVDRSIDASDNKIVIAIIDGEMTVKRLRIRDNAYWLYPENDKLKPVKIEEWMDFSVWGVVKWVVHEL